MTRVGFWSWASSKHVKLARSERRKCWAFDDSITIKVQNLGFFAVISDPRASSISRFALEVTRLFFANLYRAIHPFIFVITFWDPYSLYCLKYFVKNRVCQCIRWFSRYFALFCLDRIFRVISLAGFTENGWISTRAMMGHRSSIFGRPHPFNLFFWWFSI